MATSTDAPAPKPSVGTIMKYFGKRTGQSIADFKGEYDQLTEEDKLQLSAGIADGTLTY